MTDGPRSNSPTGNPPSVGRTPTAESLAHEIRELRKQLQKPDLEKRIERVEELANGDLLGFVRSTGARYSEVSAGLAVVSADVRSLTAALTQFREDVQRELGDHDDRILRVEDRSTRHQVRLDTIDDLQLEGRVRALERHQAGDARELSLTRSQKRRLDARAGVISTVAGGLAALLSHLLGG